MRKVYIITCTTAASRVCEFTLSIVEWVFTSKRTANKQLDIIKDKIENGGWWSDADGNALTGKVIRDVAGGYGGGILRDMLIETPNGLREIYRLQERELNSGIYLTD